MTSGRTTPGTTRLRSAPVVGLTRRPARLMFVGQATYFASCALSDECDWIETSFVDFRGGDDPARMVEQMLDRDPDVVIVFKPELVPPSALAEVSAITVGYLTEPVPREDGCSHPDLDRRLSDLRMLDPANFDRVISFDPLMVSTVETIVPVWRSVPLPVSDRYYRDVRQVRGRPRVLFLGRSTPHRESFLLRPKHRYDIVHIAHGLGPDDLERLADEFDAGINVHNEPYPNFENRACFHLAAGHLLLSEPLSPTHGLEPGIDFVEVESPERLLQALRLIFDVPDVYRRVRVRGRQKAELFRASRVYPALVLDLLRDVASFGSGRRRTADRTASGVR